MHSILDNFIYSLLLFQNLTRPDKLEGRGVLWRFLFWNFFLIFYHIYHATKTGSAAGSRDNVREAFTCFFLFFFLSSIVHFCLTLSISPFPFCCPHSAYCLQLRKELWRSTGVCMLCFFVLSRKWMRLAAFLLLVSLDAQTRRRKPNGSLAKRIWGFCYNVDFHVYTV